MVDHIPPARIHFPEEDRAVVLQQIDEALATGQLTLGEHGRAFESEFAAYVGSRYAIGVSSGTSALEIALRILGAQGKEVLVPTNTFFATPAAVLHAGGKVRFIDTDPGAPSISVDSLHENVSRDTVGVIVVHIGGIVTHRIPEIQAFCRERDLFLIEDAAHAHGSSLNGRMAGTFGDVGSFSFYPTKVITSGEGGMIVTDREDISREAIIYRDQGKSAFEDNFHTRLGYNWRMSELHAILGRAQLGRLQEFSEARRRIAAIYDQGLKGLSGIHPLMPPEMSICNYYKYIASLDEGIDRSFLKQRMRKEHHVALSGEVYDTPCHMQPVFEAYNRGSLENAEGFCRSHICLPIYPTMTPEEAERVVSSVASVLASY